MGGRIICIVCPMGCEAEVKEEGGKLVVEGCRCRKGEDYVKEEFKNPKRVLTATVFSQEGPLVPVKTSGPIPKGRIFQAMREIARLRVKLPVRVGDIIVENFLGEGVSLVATSDVG